MADGTRPDESLIGDYGKLMEEAADMAEAATLRFSRLLVGGNAGGVIATLSLIGTIIGTSRGDPFPRELFWVLTIFVVGLFSVGCLIAGNVLFSRQYHAEMLSDLKLAMTGKRPGVRGKSFLSFTKLVILPLVLRLVSACCLIAGGVLALLQLYLRSV